MKNFFKYVKSLVLIVLDISLVILILNGLVYLVFHYKVFEWCFGLVCLTAMAYCFLKQIAVGFDESYKFIRWMVYVFLIGLFMEYTFHIGAAISGGYSIEKTEGGMIINHTIFPYTSKEMLSCKEARELDPDLPIKDFGCQFFVVTANDGKKYVYEAFPTSKKLVPLIADADNLIIQGDQTLKVLKGNSVSFVNILELLD